MKFIDVPIGARFKFEEKEYIKLSDIDVYYLGKIFKFAEYLEVEIVTKCENCKWYDKNLNPEIEFQSLYCHKLRVDLGEGDFYRSLYQDPETFSCSLFEMKGGGDEKHK